MRANADTKVPTSGEGAGGRVMPGVGFFLLTGGRGSVIFREAKLEDIPALSEIRLSVMENVLSDPGRVTPEMYADYLTVSGKGWLCELDGEAVGFSVASLADTSIWALFVRPGYEGRGVGGRLLSLATDWLFEMGAPSVTLSTEAGTRADRFYEQRGWRRGDIAGEGEVRYLLCKGVRGAPVE